MQSFQQRGRRWADQVAESHMPAVKNAAASKHGRSENWVGQAGQSCRRRNSGASARHVQTQKYCQRPPSLEQAHGPVETLTGQADKTANTVNKFATGTASNQK